MLEFISDFFSGKEEKQKPIVPASSLTREIFGIFCFRINTFLFCSTYTSDFLSPVYPSTFFNIAFDGSPTFTVSERLAWPLSRRRRESTKVVVLYLLPDDWIRFLCHSWWTKSHSYLKVHKKVPIRTWPELQQLKLRILKIWIVI